MYSTCTVHVQYMYMYMYMYQGLAQDYLEVVKMESDKHTYTVHVIFSNQSINKTI